MGFTKTLTMEKMKQIDIDIDVDKVLYNHRNYFDEPYNHVLRRLLKLEVPINPPKENGNTPFKLDLSFANKRLTIQKPKFGIRVFAEEVEGNRIKALKGSLFRKNATREFAGSYAQLRNDLLAKGILNQNGELTEDYTFNSPSAAASVVLASQSNGNSWVRI